MISISTTIGNSNNKVFYLHIIVPKEVVEQFHFDGKAKRVMCSINKDSAFHAAFMPKGDGNFFININNDIIKKHNLSEGEVVHVDLKKDHSKYGMPMAEEFEACLHQDSKARTFFEALSPGKQRNLLYLVNKVRSPELRINKSLVIMEHLKATGGKLDFRLLNQRFKEATQS